MKKIFTILLFLIAFISNAQRTMFGGQNNYVAPVVPARIITTDLLLYLDASNSTSYPGSGTTWYDLSANATKEPLNFFLVDLKTKDIRQHLRKNFIHFYDI